MIRNVCRLTILACLVASAVFVPTAGSAPSATANAADLRVFNPGNIISDAVFYDAGSMNAPTIQSFLNLKGSSCTAGAMPCLKDYRQDTGSIAGDSLCAGYQGAAQEQAAMIIAKVAASCGVSPKVMLVILQKEQGLVTATRPSTWRYTAAAGYACPDTASCDPMYAGFVNQVYWSAHQYRRYQAYASSYGYRAGMYNQIAWSPNSACGKSSVFILNQATAGLYNYTPYQPNAAALAAGYGSGDGCSSYGNRNFFNYFTDWFGSTGYRVSGAIGTYYINQGGGTGSLGAPVAEMVCALQNGGCRQDFQLGSVYWSPGSGVHATYGAIRTAWRSTGSETGGLGYPNAEMFCGLTGGGCAQFFQGGAIYWAPAFGAHPLTGAIGALWFHQGYEVGGLGYPTADMVCASDGGCGQAFQHGGVFWGPTTGTHLTSGAIDALYIGQGGASSKLGLPTDDMVCGLVGSGCHQHFSGGAISWSASTGVHAINAGTAALWTSRGEEPGFLGYPTGDEVCGLTAGECSQWFQNAAVYRSSTSPAHSLSGLIGAEWIQSGADAGPLGYPREEMTCASDACSQVFQHGVLTWTSTDGVRMLTGAFALLWQRQGGATGPLGNATGDMDCTLSDGGCMQEFTGGTTYWSQATGAYSVSDPIDQAWSAEGGQDGVLGYPTSDVICTSTTSCTQQFRHGFLATSGTGGVRLVTGGFALIWGAQGAGSSWLGYPRADMTCTASGACTQAFEKGWLSWTSSAGVRTVSGAIGSMWSASGGAAGPLGAPTGDLTCGLAGGGCRQSFQWSSAQWSPLTGAHAVSGGIAQGWAATGAEHGSLGYPTGEMACTAQGCGQTFQKGALTWTPSRGLHMLSGAIAAYWSAGGGVAGALGPAVADMDCTQPAAGCVQTFQNGTVTWQGTAGTHAVSGPLLVAWSGQGGARGSLGFPTAEVLQVPTGTSQTFQGGVLNFDSGTRTVTRS